MEVKPYRREFYVIVPTTKTLFFRSFLLWQLLRFVVINLRMTIMIVMSHGKKAKPTDTKLRRLESATGHGE